MNEMRPAGQQGVQGNTPQPHRPGSPQGHPQAHAPQHGGGQPPPRIAAVPTHVKMDEPDLEPISLVEEELAPAAAPAATVSASVVAPAASQASQSKIRQFSVAAAHVSNVKLTRTPNVSGHGAIRVRTFHGRLSDEGMAYMDDKINDWIDQHAEIEVKFVTTAIGTYEGKIREPALVVNIWY